MAGIWLNTDEGGLSPCHWEDGCDLVFQIGIGKFGVRDHEGNLSDEKLKKWRSITLLKCSNLNSAKVQNPVKGHLSRHKSYR